MTYKDRWKNKAKNIADKEPEKMQAGLRVELQETFNCKKIEDARKKRGQS